MEMKNTLDSEIKMLEKEYEMLNKEYELWADVQSCLDLHQPELGEKTDVHYSSKHWESEMSLWFTHGMVLITSR